MRSFTVVVCAAAWAFLLASGDASAQQNAKPKTKPAPTSQPASKAPPTPPPAAEPAPIAISADVDPTAGAAAKVSKLFDTAVAHLEAGRWKEAEAAFQEAFDLRPNYDIAGNLGDCELRIGQAREAAEHLRFAVADFPTTGKAALKAMIVAKYVDARKEVGVLQVKVNVAGAEVVVDGRTVGKSPLAEEVFVDPGARRVEAKLAGYKAWSGTVESAKGEPREVKIELQREETEPSGGGGSAMKTALIIGGAALGVTALGLGIGFTVAANGKAADATSQLNAIKLDTPAGVTACDPAAASLEPRCAELRSTLGTLSTFSNVAVGSFVAGGVLAAGTTAFFFATRGRSPKSASAFVVPFASVTNRGVMLVGTW